MRILHICSSLAKDIGGPARSVQGLVAGLNAVGCESWLLALKPLGRPWMDGIAHFSCAGCKSFLGVRSAVRKTIDECHPDVVHIQSIWMLNMHEAAAACRDMGVPYVFSVRGALNPWAFSQRRWKKLLALRLYQQRDFQLSAGFHATSEEEAEAIRRHCPQARICIVPNGVNVPVALPPRNRRDVKKRLLFLGRIHAVKGLAELLQAWALVDSDIRKDWLLEIVGNDDCNYWQFLKALPCWDAIRETVVCHDFMDDVEKWIAYRNADCFILPSHSENFGIVIAEALYAGLPVITTTNTPWRDLKLYDCGWWVELSPKSLGTAIVEMMRRTDDERKSMGGRGRKLIESKYTWAAASCEMRKFYDTIRSK